MQSFSEKIKTVKQKQFREDIKPKTKTKGSKSDYTKQREAKREPNYQF